MSLILNKYKNKRRLGGGAFGDVQLVLDQNGNQFALKMISKNIIAKEPYMEEYIEGEKQCMMSLKSEYVVRLFNVQEDDRYKYFLCEYCDGGDLLSLQAKQPNKVFSLKQSIKILSQVIMGLEHVHKNGYLHRDIKLQNILVKKGSNGNNTFKLADFGFAKRLENVNGTVLGTENYMSPEIYLNQIYSYEVDMWAFGVLFFFMLNMEFPFNINIHSEPEEKRQELLNLAKNFSYEARVKKSNKKLTQNCTSEIEDIFQKMFEINSQKRINFSQIRSHPLFKQYFPNPDRQLAEIYEKNTTINRFDSFRMGKMSAIRVGEQKKVKKYILSDEQHFEVSPSCFLKKPKTTQQNQIIQIDLQKVDFLKDAVEQLSYNISFVEPSQILAFRYNVFKFYVVLLRDLYSNLNPEYYQQRYPKLKWSNYFKSSQSETTKQEVRQHLAQAQMKVSETYDQCKNSFSAIKKINPNIQAIFEREVSQKQFTAGLKASYRISTSGLFSKLRQKANTSNNQFTYLTLLVLMIHGFNNIVKTSEEDLGIIFQEFKAKNKDARIDFRMLKGWFACLDKQKLKNLILVVNNTYFGGK